MGSTLVCVACGGRGGWRTIWHRREVMGAIKESVPVLNDCPCCKGAKQVSEDLPVIEIRVINRRNGYVTAEAWHGETRIRVTTWPTVNAALAEVGVNGSLAHNVYQREFPGGYRLEIRPATDAAA